MPTEGRPFTLAKRPSQILDATSPGHGKSPSGASPAHKGHHHCGAHMHVDHDDHLIRKAAEGERTGVWYKDHGLWPEPKLLRDGPFDDVRNYERERDMTWSELFFDLIFVVAIARLGDQLRESSMTIWHYFVYFLQFWNTWAEAADYSNRFGTNDLPNMLFFGCVMGCVVFMTLHLRGNEDDPEAPHAILFSRSIFAAQFCFVAVYGRIALLAKRPRAVGQARFRLLSIAVPTILLGILAWCPHLDESLVWPLQVGAAIAPPGWITVFLSCQPPIERCFKFDRWIGKTAPLHLEHMNERVGLLVIIFFGEMVDDITQTVEPTWELYWAVLSCFLIVLWLKSLYFEVDAVDADQHAIRRSRVTYMMWRDGQMCMCGGVAVVGSGLNAMCAKIAEGEDMLNGNRQQFVCSGLSVILISINTIVLSHKREWHGLTSESRLLLWTRRIFWCQIAVQFMVSLAIYALPSAELPDVYLLACIAAILFALVVVNLVDEVIEVHFEEAEEAEEEEHASDLQQNLNGLDSLTSKFETLDERLKQMEVVYSPRGSPDKKDCRMGSTRS